MSMYSARVPDLDDDDLFMTADFADFDQAQDDDSQEWDIAAFSKISVVTVDNDKAEGDDMVQFDADFPASFDFPGFGDAEEKADNKKDEEESEQEEEEDSEQEDSDDDDDDDDEEEEEEDDDGDEENEEDENSKQTDISEERGGTPIPMTPESSRSVSSDVQGAAPVESDEAEELETPKTTKASDVWADVADAVQSAKTLAKGLEESTRKFSMQVSQGVAALDKSSGVEGDSVPSVASSSFDSSVDSSCDDDDESVDDKSHASSKSAARIRAFFAKRSKRSDGDKKATGSVKSGTSKDKSVKSGASRGKSVKSGASKDKSVKSGAPKDKFVKSGASKNKSTASNVSKKRKIKLKGMHFGFKDNGDTKQIGGKGSRTKQINDVDDVSISDEDDVVESSPERQTRVYKIMRKKRRGKSCTDRSFLEDLAEEFFTCSYFFKCLGDVAVSQGSELESQATSCCRGAPGDVVDETVPIHDEPEEVYVKVTPDSPSAANLPAGFLASWRPNKSTRVE